MFNCIATLTAWAVYHAYSRAVLAGAALGWIVWTMSRTPDPSAFTLAMALTVVAAGGTSFVLFARHERAARTRAGSAETRAEGRMIVSLLGGALALSVNALQLLAD